MLYAIGRIVIIVPHGSALKADSELNDLAAGIQDGRVKKFAIANPEHAPYGRAAQQALTKAGLWDKVQDRLVLGENVSQATQFATSGSAQGGIVALSLALSPAVSKLGSYALLRQNPRTTASTDGIAQSAGETAKNSMHSCSSPRHGPSFGATASCCQPSGKRGLGSVLPFAQAGRVYRRHSASGSLIVGRFLAWTPLRGKVFLEAVLALPL